MFSDLQHRLRAVFRRALVERELEQELQFHLARETEKLIAAGVARDEAIRSARLSFGGMDAVREAARDVRGVSWLETTTQDVTYGLRVLRRSPVFTAVAVLSLAIGIGATTAIFSVVDAVFIKPLPIERPDSLYLILGNDNLPGLDYPTFTILRGHRELFASLAAVGEVERSNILIGSGAGVADPRPSVIHLVSGNYFLVLGVHAAKGRTLLADDDVSPGGGPVAVLSDAYAIRRFGSAERAVGMTLTLNATRYTVVGVVPPEFTGDMPGRPADLWMPITMQPQVMTERPDLLTNPRPPWVRMLARLAPGATPERVSTAVSVIYQQALMSQVAPGQRSAAAAAVARIHVPLHADGRGYAPDRQALAKPVFALFAIIALVLLAACVNVAGLLLGRAVLRQREIATRLAVGASRGRIARQLLTEGLLLSLVGSALGALLAWAGMRFGQQIIAGGVDPLSFDLTPDGRVVAVAAAICIATGVASGLAPAARSGRLALVPSLKAADGVSRATGSRALFGKGLVIAQVALSIVLIVAAGLFARTLSNLRQRPLGYDRSRVLLAWTAPTQAGITKGQLADLFDVVTARLSALPGVREVAVSSRGTLGTLGVASPIRVPGYVARDDDPAITNWNVVTPNFFSASGIPIVTGRAFRRSDDVGGTRAVIVSEALARHYFANENPIGKHIGIRRGEDFPLEIIGVARDAVDNSLRAEPAEMLYFPYRQDMEHLSDMCVIIRTTEAPGALSESVRRAIRQAAPALPVLAVNPIIEQMNRTLVQEKISALVAELLGALTLSLAAIGLYAVISQSVSVRATEFAVRLALGGSREAVIGMIVRESLSLVGVGIVCGLIVSQVVVHAIASQFFGVSPVDPLTIGIATAIMIAVALTATVIPAARVARIDLMAVLRTG